MDCSTKQLIERFVTTSMMRGQSINGGSYRLPGLSDSNVIIGVNFEWNGGAVIVEGNGTAIAMAIERFKRTANVPSATTGAPQKIGSDVGEKSRNEPNVHAH